MTRNPAEPRFGRNPPETPRLDDVIVDLHETGETVFQAIGRAARFPGVDRYDPALLVEVPEGRIPLRNGAVTDMRPLDARGVAAILDFEIDSAEYDASRCLLDEPVLPPEPRVPVEDLWPALRAAGYHVVGATGSPRRYRQARSALAHQTGLNVRQIHRICAGDQERVPATTAVAILDAVGRGDLANKVDEEHLASWRSKRADAYYGLFEYRDALARLALIWRNDAGLTDEERCALSDVCWLSTEAQLVDGPDDELLTAGDRIRHADERFSALHGRRPIPLSRRLRDRARAHFRSEQKRARSRAAELRRGTPLSGKLTAKSVYGRTHRLRSAGVLSRRSRPRALQPPVDWTDAITTMHVIDGS